jgi:hypothetical protein
LFNGKKANLYGLFVNVRTLKIEIFESQIILSFGSNKTKAKGPKQFTKPDVNPHRIGDR